MIASAMYYTPYSAPSLAETFRLDVMAGQDVNAIDFPVEVSATPLKFVLLTSASQDSSSHVDFALTSLSFLPPSLLRKYQFAVHRARVYREKQGNPIDHLVNLFDELVQDQGPWREILDEPYG